MNIFTNFQTYVLPPPDYLTLFNSFSQGEREQYDA